MSDVPAQLVLTEQGGDDAAPRPLGTVRGVRSRQESPVLGSGDVARRMEPEWRRLWATVAQRVAAHGKAGRTHLLTEDVVRFETVLALEELGIAPDRMAVEVRASSMVGGRLDLVIDGLAGAVVELKFPRDSRTGISPDT